MFDRLRLLFAKGTQGACGGVEEIDVGFQQWSVAGSQAHKEDHIRSFVSGHAILGPGCGVVVEVGVSTFRGQPWVGCRKISLQPRTSYLDVQRAYRLLVENRVGVPLTPQLGPPFQCEDNCADFMYVLLY